MTAEQKQKLAFFFDAAGAALHGGYGDGVVYQFTDDQVAANQITDMQVIDNQLTDSQATDDQLTDSQVTDMPDAGAALDGIAAEIARCLACPLGSTRKSTVPGEGALRPEVLGIGEGPGADEDASGRPFVGRAGQLLDKMLAAIGLYRDKNCYIANVVKCRPPGNRDPAPDEKQRCIHFLEAQIAALRPGFILCVGRIAAQTMLNTEKSMGSLRDRFYDYYDSAGRIIPLIVTYHPSYLLRDESQKRYAWEDLKKLKARMEEAGKR
jgi:DNA polymerase